MNARELTARVKAGEISAEDVKPADCGMADESWFVAEVAGQWAAWSDGAADQDPRFYGSRDEAVKDWADGAAAERSTLAKGEEIGDDILDPKLVEKIQQTMRGPKLDAEGRIVGGVYHGMTPAEVIEDRDSYRRMIGE